MLRYPTSHWAGHLKGINHYGTVKTSYGTAYKVSFQNIEQLTRIGWRHVGQGTAYAYMLKP